LWALRDRGVGLDLIGFDVDPAAVAAVSGSMPDVRTEVVDLNDGLPLESASVDGIVSHNVVECLRDPVATMDEAARVLRRDGRAVWSHVDFDAIVIAGPDRDLTRAVLHTYSDRPPSWMTTGDGQMGRKLAGLVRSSALQLQDVSVHLTTATSLEGDALARIDEIAASVDTSAGTVSTAEVAEWRRQVEHADRAGEFLFVEPCFVVSAGHH
jgi:SAM-dependent methyltransferase